MNERIKELRKILDLTQENFSSKLNLSRNFIAQIELGTKKPSERTIIDICEAYNVNRSWLESGEGEMFKKRTRAQEISEFANSVMEETDQAFKKRFFLALSKLNERDWETLEKIVDELTKED